MKVFGIDIIKGSVRSTTKKPVFALAIRNDGVLVETFEVSIFRLMRKIDSERPDILAVDSIFEIAENQQKLAVFMQSLPSSTKLVQVTGGDVQESLQRVAARYNIKLLNKLDPYSEAKTTAHVAELGAGFEVIAFENSCEITVSKSRSLGCGGWSQNRYARKVHGAVLVRSREIEGNLKEHALRYTKKEIAGFGGMRRVIFHVTAQKKDIPVQSERCADYQVRITAKKLDKIKYAAQNNRKKYVIAGIDPGTTVGIAVLDLDGNLLKLKSSRLMSLSDWTEEILQVGIPIAVASDVTPMPTSVEKIRKAFNAEAFIPREPRTQDEKFSLCCSWGFKFANDHERDSLAAAIDAYRAYRQRFLVIEKRIPQGYDLNRVRAGIIRGLSPEQIIAKIGGKESRGIVKGITNGVVNGIVNGGLDFDTNEEIKQSADLSPNLEESEPKFRRIAQLEGMVKDLKMHLEDLQKDLGVKNKEIAALKRDLLNERTKRAEARRNNIEIVTRDNQIVLLKKRLHKEEKENRRLSRKVERLKNFDPLMNDDKDSLPVKVLSALTKENLKELDDELGIREGDIIYIGKTAGWGNASLSILSDSLICAVIADSDDENLLNALRDQDVPLIRIRDVPVTIRGRVGSIRKEPFDNSLAIWKAKQEIYLKEKNKEKIISLIANYKNQRVVEARYADKMKEVERKRKLQEMRKKNPNFDDESKEGLYDLISEN